MKFKRAAVSVVLSCCMFVPAAFAAALPQSFQGKWAPDCHSAEAEMLGIEVDGNMAYYGIEECSAEKVAAKGNGIDIEFECAVLMDASEKKIHWELTGKDSLAETDAAKPGAVTTYQRCASAKR
ncbi:MAG: hypothetical protein PHH36_00010 [Sideroxydans sp.]|nr:hypothetical protein [Sideroxydans sp.]